MKEKSTTMQMAKANLNMREKMRLSNVASPDAEPMRAAQKIHMRVARQPEESH
jgi:hypothetical protein